MTRVDELTADRIELNPDVPFPPFPLWISVPSSWSPLDSHPNTWQRSAENLIDTTFRGSRLPTKERREVMSLLEGLVADCQRAGAALSLITVGRRAVGGSGSFGLHMAFASDGRPASLGRVHDILPRTGLTEEVATAVGPGVLHRDRMTMMVPGTAQVAALTSIQIFVPIPDTSWTVVLSTASAYPELTDPLEALLRSVAASIRLGENARENAGGDETATPDVEFDASASSTGPGFERGFSTLVQRRLDPPVNDPDRSR